jgi:esterase/lipase superfamily enzyme
MLENVRERQHMAASFWDFIAAQPRLDADAFGDYARLLKKGTVARPREVSTLEELRVLLRSERVDFDRERIKAVWKAYAHARKRQHESVG